MFAVRILFDCSPTQAETSARVKFGLEIFYSDLFIGSNITNLVSNEWTKTHLYVLKVLFLFCSIHRIYSSKLLSPSLFVSVRGGPLAVSERGATTLWTVVDPSTGVCQPF